MSDRHVKNHLKELEINYIVLYDEDFETNKNESTFSLKARAELT